MKSNALRSRKFFLLATITLFIISLLVLAGWQFDIQVFKRILPNFIAMNPVTAICFILCTLSLFYFSKPGKRSHAIATSLSFIVFGIGFIKMTSFIFHFPVNIDTWLFPEKILSDIIGGKTNSMAPNTALNMMLTGIALIFIKFGSKKKNYLADLFSIVVAMIAFISLIGYLYGAVEFYGIKYYVPMAFHTAVCFLLVSFSILVQRSNIGLFKLLIEEHEGAKLARRLLPLAILVPVILGLFKLFGQHLNLYSLHFGTTLFAISNILIFIYLVWHSSILVGKSSKALAAKILENKKAQEELLSNHLFIDALLENIPDMIFLKDSEELRFVRINKAGEKLLGISRDELIGKNDFDFFPSEQATFFYSKDREVLDKGQLVFIEEEKITTKEGECWLQTKKIPLKGPNNNQTYLLGISQDITIRKKQDDQLKEFNKQLEQKVIERTSQILKADNERKKLETALLQEKFNKQKELLKATIDGQEIERKEIGMELHDNINQILASTKLFLEVAASDNKLAHEFIHKSIININTSIDEIRKLSKTLVPPDMEEAGLLNSITDIIETIHLSTTVKVNLQVPSTNLKTLSQPQKITIYRIIQEQLSNILKHAGAKKVNIRIALNGSQLTLDIDDNGKGFDPSIKKQGIGLLNIQNRVNLLDGQFQIISDQGRGCLLKISFPLQAA
jgi:PAS domain S-box-containing protein